VGCATDRSHLQDEVASKQLMVTELGILGIFLNETQSGSIL